MAKNYPAKLLEDNDGNLTRVRTSLARLSFPHLFEKDSMSDKYGCTLLIPKTDEAGVKAIKTAIKNAEEVGRAKKWGGKAPKGLRLPLKDGDDSDYEGYAGCYAISVTTNRLPQIFDAEGLETDDPEDIYPGCYVQAFIKFTPYDKQGKGVTGSLESLRKRDDGERLGGSGVKFAADDFDDEVDENDDLGL